MLSSSSIVLLTVLNSTIQVYDTQLDPTEKYVTMVYTFHDPCSPFCNDEMQLQALQPMMQLSRLTSLRTLSGLEHACAPEGTLFLQYARHSCTGT